MSALYRISIFVSKVAAIVLSLIIFMSLSQTANAQYIISNTSISSLDNVREHRFGLGDVRLNMHPLGRIKFSFLGDGYAVQKSDFTYFNERKIDQFLEANAIYLPNAISANFYKAAHLDDIVFIELADANIEAKNYFIMAMEVSDEQESEASFRMVVPRGSNIKTLSETKPEDFIAHPREDWLINRHLFFGKDKLTVNHAETRVLYQSQQDLIRIARYRIIEKVGIELGDKHIATNCTALASGFSFQSAGRDLYNQGKLVDVYYRNGRCTINLIFGRKDQIFIASNADYFECAEQTCTFPMFIYHSSNGYRARYNDRQWMVTVTQDDAGDYQLVDIKG